MIRHQGEETIRDRQGSAMVLVSSTTLIVVFVGIAIAGLGLLTGAGRELQNATDSGALNVAKQALRFPGVALDPGTEQNNFSVLTDNQSGKPVMNLLKYNTVVGQALLVELNATQDTARFGASSRRESNLKALRNATCGGDASLCGRLLKLLSAGKIMGDRFGDLGKCNSLRMANPGGQGAAGVLKHVDETFDIAHLEPGTATNIFVDASILPTVPAKFLTKEGKRTYLRGYVPMRAGSFAEVMGTPLFPRKQPHLVSQKLFEENTAPPPGPISLPNSFKSQAQSAVDIVHHAANGLGGSACALTGVVSADQEFPLSIPGGYIEFLNPKGAMFVGMITGPASFVTTGGAGARGIFVANNRAGSPSVFATSNNLGNFLAWADWNQDPQGPPPAFVDGQFFRADGSPATLADMMNLSPGFQYCGGPGGTMSSGCWPHFRAFSRAYDGGAGAFHQGPDPSKPPTMAVEYQKPYCYERVFYGEQASIPPANVTTGLRVYRSDHVYHAFESGQGKAWGQISNDGTVKQLLKQTRANDGTVTTYLFSRIRQIKPEATDAEINQALASVKLPLRHTASSLYLFMDQKTRKLLCSSVPPPQVVFGTTPDGGDITLGQRDYSLLGDYVNPPHDHDIHIQPWQAYSGSWVGHDKAILKTSSGFNNLLGQVRFENKVTGTIGNFADFN